MVKIYTSILTSPENTDFIMENKQGELSTKYTYLILH